MEAAGGWPRSPPDHRLLGDIFYSKGVKTIQPLLSGDTRRCGRFYLLGKTMGATGRVLQESLDARPGAVAKKMSERIG